MTSRLQQLCRALLIGLTLCFSRCAHSYLSAVLRYTPSPRTVRGHSIGTPARAGTGSDALDEEIDQSEKVAEKALIACRRRRIRRQRRTAARSPARVVKPAALAVIDETLPHKRPRAHNRSLPLPARQCDRVVRARPRVRACVRACVHGCSFAFRGSACACGYRFSYACAVRAS